MGESSLRCQGCGGKFGPPDVDQRCIVCGPLYRVSDLLLSDRFPACLGESLAVNLRQAYLSGLVAADNYWRDHQGGEKPPGKTTGDTEAKDQELHPKSKAQPPQVAEEETTEVKEEVPNYSPEKSPEPTREKKRETLQEEEKAINKRSRSRRSPLPRAPRRSRERRRSRSPQSSHRRRERSRSDHREGDRGGREKKRRPRSEERSRGGSESAPASSSLRPRSPPGPPPHQRWNQGRWTGPIPAYNRQNQWRRENEAENKGVKKRKQQALLREFKAWRKNQRRRR